MAIKFEKVKPGMELLNIRSQKIGNTTMSQLAMFKVHIVSVDERGAMVRWNNNPPQFWARRQVEKLYTKPTKKYLAQQAAKRR